MFAYTNVTIIVIYANYIVINSYNIVQHIDYQGEKFKGFISKLKNNYNKYGFDKKPTNEEIAQRLGVSPMQLNRYYKSNSLQRETVIKITEAFNVSEEYIWGSNNNEPNGKPVSFSNNEPNMWIVPIKAQGGFLGGYGDQIYLESFLKKVPFPFIKGECFAFEIEGESMLTEFVPRNYFIGSTIEDKNFLVKGRPYVFQTTDGIIIKCFDYFDDEFMYLYSLNQEFNPVVPIPLKNIKKIYQKEGYLEL